MSYVGQVRINSADNPVAATLYATCDTQGATKQKQVTIENVDALIDGMTIKILFQYANAHASPTLKINSLTAYPIYTRGTSYPGKTALTSWQPNSLISLTFTGSAWMMNDTVMSGNQNITDLISLVYPVGAIYISTASTSPATLFGFGTWERIQGQFLLGAGTTPGTSDSFSAGSSGGAKTVQLTTAAIPAHHHQVSAHSHTIASHKHSVSAHNHTYSKSATATGTHKLTVAEMPSHGHLVRLWNNAGYTEQAYYYDGATKTNPDNGIQLDYSKNGYSRETFEWKYDPGILAAQSGKGDQIGGADKAGGDGTHTHPITLATANTGNGGNGETGGTSLTTSQVAAANTANTGGGGAHENMPPYLAVYIWKRTA